MIDFEFEPQVKAQLKVYHAVAETMMRPISREYDEHEHEKPWQFFEAMWSAAQNLGPAAMPEKAPANEKGDGGTAKLRNLYTCLSTEELCWGDAGLFLSIPNPGLGGAAVAAAGSAAREDDSGAVADGPAAGPGAGCVENAPAISRISAGRSFTRIVSPCAITALL